MTEALYDLLYIIKEIVSIMAMLIISICACKYIRSKND